MRILPAAALVGVALALTACGSADNAADDAMADTVEAPADDALADVTEEPVADPALAEPVAVETPAPVSEATANEAADSAADAAAEIDAMLGEVDGMADEE